MKALLMNVYVYLGLTGGFIFSILFIAFTLHECAETFKKWWKKK